MTTLPKRPSRAVRDVSTSLERIQRTLATLAPEFFATPPTTPAPLLFVPAIPVGRLDADRGNYTLIDPAKILYVFLGSPKVTGSLAVPWTHRLEHDHAYLRTRMDVYWTPFRGVRQLASRLYDPDLVLVARGIYARLSQFVEVNQAAQRLGAATGSGERPTEWIRCSKRGWRNVSRRLVLPRGMGGRALRKTRTDV